MIYIYGTSPLIPTSHGFKKQVFNDLLYMTKLCHTFLTHLLILHRGHLLLEDPEPCLLLLLREPTHGKQTAFAERLHHCILISWHRSRGGDFGVNASPCMAFRISWDGRGRGSIIASVRFRWNRWWVWPVFPVSGRPITIENDSGRAQYSL